MGSQKETNSITSIMRLLWTRFPHHKASAVEAMRVNEVSS